MLKLTALAIGLLTVISIAPQSQAMTTNIDAPSLQQPAANLHSQIILKVSEQPRAYSNHRRHGESQDRYRAHRRERELERERQWEYERELDRNREAKRYRQSTPTAIIKIGDIIKIKL
jgi:hypothetical protein